MKFIYALVFALSAQVCFSQHLPKELKGIDDEIIQLMKEYSTIGLSVALVKNDKVIYSKGFGYRDVDKKIPADVLNVLF